MNVKHLDYFRTAKPDDPQFGQRLAEALSSIQAQSNNTEEQGNLNPSGQPIPPPNVSGVSVSAQNGHFQVAIHDQSENLRRGVSYWVEHSAYPDFRESHQEELGAGRNWQSYMGNVNRYFRVFSSYSASHRSDPVYHGSPAQPTRVNGGGDNAGPAFLPSQGSGTGAPGQGATGPGPLPVRTPASGVNWTSQRGARK